MKDFEEQIVDNDDEVLNIVNEIKILFEEDEYKNDCIKDLKKDYPDKIFELEEPLLDYMGENDSKFLETGFPDKLKYFTKKFAYPYEYFNSINDCQKLVNDSKKEDFFNLFSKLKNKCPSNEEIERTMNII